MKLILLLPILAILVLSGCDSEQTSSENSSPPSTTTKSPEQVSQEFIGFLEQSKWSKACEMTDPAVQFSNCEQLFKDTVSSFGKAYLNNFKNPSSTEIKGETATVWFGAQKQSSMTLKRIDGEWYYNAMGTLQPTI